uniref:Uncharacterized protein n=1 Tax=Steinernema glaseri TaxID=37863 RepID=A0A1I7Z6D3_9BILA
MDTLLLVVSSMSQPQRRPLFGAERRSASPVLTNFLIIDVTRARKRTPLIVFPIARTTKEAIKRRKKEYRSCFLQSPFKGDGMALLTGVRDMWRANGLLGLDELVGNAAEVGDILQLLHQMKRRNSIFLDSFLFHGRLGCEDCRISYTRVSVVYLCLCLCVCCLLVYTFIIFQCTGRSFAAACIHSLKTVILHTVCAKDDLHVRVVPAEVDLRHLRTPTGVMRRDKWDQDRSVLAIGKPIVKKRLLGGVLMMLIVRGRSNVTDPDLLITLYRMAPE